MTAGAGDAVRWADLEQEADELIAEAARRSAVLRLVGSAGIRMHCDAARSAMASLDRPAKDIDLVCRSSDREAVRALFEERGYDVDRDVLIAAEGTRYAFHRTDGIDVDLFVDRLEFCHTIELGNRIAREAVTIPIEDLLLQKLQIVEQTPSDLLDTATLLATHEVADGDGPESIDSGYIGSVLGRDWGFHRTAVANLHTFARRVAAGEVGGLAAETSALVRERATALIEASETAPKSLAWKLRAKIGDRAQWWNEVQAEREHY